MDNSRFYIKVITTVKEDVNSTNSAMTSHANKLLKLAYETKDTVLREALLACNVANKRVTYSSYGGSRWINNKDVVLPACKEADKLVIDLVTERMETEKPEWQIIAEQNGWTPPK